MNREFDYLTAFEHVSDRLCKIFLHSNTSPLSLPLGLVLTASNIERWKFIFDKNLSDEALNELILDIIVWWLLYGCNRSDEMYYKLTSAQFDYLCHIDDGKDISALPRFLKSAIKIFDLNMFGNTTEPQTRHKIWDWFYREHTEIVLQVPQFLNQALDLICVSRDVYLPRVLYVTWYCRQDLNQTFTKEDPDWSLRLLSWFFAESHSNKLLRYAAKMLARRPYSGSPDVFLKWSNIAERCISHHPNDCSKQLTPLPPSNNGFIETTSTPQESLCSGVNIIGFIHSATGLGEDARMGIASAISAGITTLWRDIPAKNSDGIGLISCFRENRLYNLNIVYTAAPYIVSTFNSMPYSWWYHKNNIISIAWELPDFPQRLIQNFAYADMVWAPTWYIYNSIVDTFERDTIYMPLAVSIPKIKDIYDRKYYNIPEDCFVFSYVFDLSSGLARKNPHALIKAFKIAFPQRDQSVRLCLKCSSADKNDSKYKNILKCIGKDNRISVVDRMMTRNEVLGFIASCDAYVSPHRSEGFGRTIAEAMLLGRPVIVTAFSGNLDFTNDKTAYLVNGKLIDLKEYEYPLWEGQKWFNPDIEELAYLMRLCREQPVIAQKKALAGQALIRKNYCPKIVGEKYRKVLEEFFGMKF